MTDTITQYFDTLAALLKESVITDKEGAVIPHLSAYSRAIQVIEHAHAAGNKVMFIGNGGSAGIASHQAIDYLKNGGIRAMAFNDPAALTCLGNDLGYENVFSKQIDMHARKGDVLIAISSSGKSKNILNAADVALQRGCYLITLSGFDAENPLRTFGNLNFYVDSKEYGFVEIAHLALIHAILDIKMGWGKDTQRVVELTQSRTKMVAAS